MVVEVLVFGPSSDFASDDAMNDGGCASVFASEEGMECLLVDECNMENNHNEERQRSKGVVANTGYKEVEKEKKKKRVRKLLKKFQRQFRRLKGRNGLSVNNESNDTVTTATTNSTLSDSSWLSQSMEVFTTLSTSTSASFEAIPTPLIESRIRYLNILGLKEKIKFVEDEVSKEVIELRKICAEAEDSTEAPESSDESENDVHFSHVKTGIWQIVTSVLDGDGSLQEQAPFYIVTAVKMEDRVDTKKLRRAIFSPGIGQPQTFARRPKLSMAPTDIAETLVGYKSGTMAPICHSVNMKLFMEESIFEKGMEVDKHKINVGSGMFGKCLSLSADAFLRIAEANPEGVELVPLIQKRKQKTSSPTCSNL